MAAIATSPFTSFHVFNVKARVGHLKTGLISCNEIALSPELTLAKEG
jgi:hypothetical protein